MPARPRIAIVGDGNVGSALLAGLQRAGHEVEAVGKEPEDVRQIAHQADAVFLAVPLGQRLTALTVSCRFAASFERSGVEEL